MLVEGAWPVARVVVVAAELVMDTPGPVPTICTPAGSWATMVPNPAACDRVYVPGGTLIETVPARRSPPRRPHAESRFDASAQKGSPRRCIVRVIGRVDRERRLGGREGTRPLFQHRLVGVAARLGGAADGMRGAESERRHDEGNAEDPAEQCASAAKKSPLGSQPQLSDRRGVRPEGTVVTPSPARHGLSLLYTGARVGRFRRMTGSRGICCGLVRSGAADPKPGSIPSDSRGRRLTAAPRVGRRGGRGSSCSATRGHPCELRRCTSRRHS